MLVLGGSAVSDFLQAVDCCLPGPFVRGIFQAKVLGWVAAIVNTFILSAAFPITTSVEIIASSMTLKYFIHTFYFMRSAFTPLFSLGILGKLVSSSFLPPTASCFQHKDMLKNS